MLLRPSCIFATLFVDFSYSALISRITSSDDEAVIVTPFLFVGFFGVVIRPAQHGWGQLVFGPNLVILEEPGLPLPLVLALLAMGGPAHAGAAAHHRRRVAVAGRTHRCTEPGDR